MTLHEVGRDSEVVPQWTIGDRLRKAREVAGIGVEEMAVRLDRQRNSIRRWERLNRADPMVIRFYAVETGVPESWLRGENEPPYKPTTRSGGDTSFTLGETWKPRLLVA